MEIIIASNNKNKIAEIKKMMPEGIVLKSLNEIGYYDEIDENGTTFEQNALIKAKTIYDIYKRPVISDDSGLEVDALNGAPGVYSHRYAGEMCDDKLNNEKLVQNMKNIENKNAHYTCVLCYYDGKEHFYRGECHGLITLAPAGENGFGYDPYFYISELKKNMAELSMDEKNKISHRAKALSLLKENLDELLGNIR